MATKEQQINKFYTEAGFESLKNRFGTLVKFFNAGEYPIRALILGFGTIEIKDKEQLLGMIHELAMVTFQSYIIEKEIIKNQDGTQEQKEKIRWLSA